MKIRYFNDQDIEDIYLAEQKAFDVGAYSKREINSMVHSKNSFSLVIEENDFLIGYATAAEMDDSSMDIESIAIIPEFQGRGYGSLLINKIESEIIKRNYKISILEVREKNDTAYIFYLKHGYKFLQFLNNYYSIPYKGSKNAYRLIKNLV